MSAAGGGAPLYPDNPWWVAIAVLSATFMEVLDTTVVNVSLPHIAGSLSATPEEATWSLTSYLVANAVVLPMTGWLAERVGRKRLLLASVAAFTATSLLCGLAGSLAALVTFRVLQGLSGGALQPLSQAVMLESFPPEKRGRAMGMWALGIVVAPMLGPILGGWLTDRVSWHWIFFVNVPIGLGSFLAIRSLLQDPPYLKRRERKEAIDGWGLGLLVVGLGALQILLDKGQQDDWFASGAMRALALVSAVALVALVVRELAVEHPILDLRIFRVRSYASGVALITGLGVVLYGSITLLPLMLQTLLGYSAYEAGLATSPRGLGSFVAMPIVGIMVGRYGGKRLLAIGLVLSAGTLFWLGRLNLAAGPHDFFWPQIVLGAALGLLFVPLTTLSMAEIPQRSMGYATSLFNVMRNIGGSVGIALTTTLVARGSQAKTALVGAHVDAFRPAAREFLASSAAHFRSLGVDPMTAALQAKAAAFAEVARQAAAIAFLGAFRTLALVFLAMLPLVFLLGKAPKGRGPNLAH
jgi:DHA2 family multidrug resistance protein